LAFLLLAPTLQAEEVATADPVVDVQLPKYYILRKKLFFPLDAPGYIIHGLFKPLSVAGKYIENEHIVPKIMDFLSNDARTFFVLPSIQGESGHGVGFGIFTQYTNLFHQNYVLKTDARIFGDGDHIATLSISSPPIDSPAAPPLGYGPKTTANPNRRIDAKFIASWRRHGDEEFFGVGTASPAANRSEFAFYEFLSGFLLNYKLNKTVRLSPHLNFINTKGDEGVGDFEEAPPTETVLPASQIVGFERRFSYVDAGITAAHDTRDFAGAPERGGLRRFTFRRLQGIEQKNFDYFQYDVDFRQFFRLWLPRRVLALRNAWSFQHTTGTNQIPFYRLTVLDSSHALRGFRFGRFHDKSSVLFNAEYRYMVWDLIDMTLFYDTGKVFNDIEEFDFDDFEYSYGGGFRFRSDEAFIFRAQIGYGGEDVIFSFTAALAI
jgi:hypothetical protein